MTITAIHENGSHINITRDRMDLPRTIELMRQSGYQSFWHLVATPQGGKVLTVVPGTEAGR